MIQAIDGSYLMIRFYLRDWCGILQARNLNCNQDIIILRPSCWPDCIGVLVAQSHSRLTRIVLFDVVCSNSLHSMVERAGVQGGYCFMIHRQYRRCSIELIQS